MKGEKQVVFKGRMIESKWDLDEDFDRTWNEMTSCIKRVPKEVIGEYKGCMILSHWPQRIGGGGPSSIGKSEWTIQVHLDVETMLLM